MDQFKILLSTNMKTARERLELSQSALAERAQLASSYIAQIETGRSFPSSVTLCAIAGALRLKPYQLFLDNSESIEFNKRIEITALKSELRESLLGALDSLIDQHLEP